MPNDNPSGWTTERIIAILGAFFAGCSLLISTWNNTKLHTVENQQVVNTKKIEETHVAVGAAKSPNER